MEGAMKITKILALFFILALLVACGGKNSSSPDMLANYYDKLYITSSNPVHSPVGTWRYSNNMFFEFKADNSWRYYKIEPDEEGNDEEVNEYSGTWSVHEHNGISYLKLIYTKIYYNFLAHGWIEDPDSGEYYWGITSNSRLAKDYEFPRYQIVEFYADDNYFAMNIYRNKNNNNDFYGSWVHNNYDWYDEFNLVVAVNEQKTNLGTGEDEWVSTTYSSVVFFSKPIEDGGMGKVPIYTNRTGTLTFKSSGRVDYSHTSPFFVLGEISSQLGAGLESGIPLNPHATDTGTYYFGTSPQDNLTQLSWSGGELLGNLTFSILIVEDKNILMTYPFKKVSP